MIRWPFAGRRERLRRQASDWIARLNGPHGARERAAFERWYRASPDHAAAYDRLAALFETAANMRPAAGAGVAEPRNGRERARPVRYALAAAAAALCIVLLAFAVLGASEAPPPAQAGPQIAVFAATGGESRHVVLADGSEVVLAPGSELAVAIGGEERRLRLKSGEGRFTVSHEARPFVVEAEGAEVVARGTRFVVRLGKEGTLVSLIEGRIDVSYPPALDRAQPLVARLTPGQRVIVPAIRTPLSAPAAFPQDPRPGMTEFDDTRLADAVERVNRQGAGRIGLADPALGELRVTGAFRAGDAEGFARGVAAALDLEVSRRADGSLWLRPAPAGAVGE